MNTACRTVARGPVPRHAAIAGDRPPRYDKRRFLGPKGPKTMRPKKRCALPRSARALGCHTRIRAGFPRHCSRARPCRSESPDSDPFVIRRAQTTEAETHIVTMELARACPPRYGHIETRRSLLPNTPKYETPSDIIPPFRGTCNFSRFAKIANF